MTDHTTDDSTKGLKTLLEDYERALILSALAAAGGHQRRAARTLGLLPSTLSEKMKRLGIRRPTTSSPPEREPGEPQEARAFE